MSKAFTYLIIAVLFVMLILIRFFEDNLFYDPYLTFFQNDYLYIDSPRRELAKLLVNIVFRYVLNTTISLAIIYMFFKEKSIVKFSGVIYGVAFVILIILYLYFVINPRQEDYYLFFNIRRFLIQPILLLLLLPAFYYQKKQNLNVKN
ncbi:exosortase F system-associated membrane protein [Neotamlana laminarinivorans]|uniref:Exosortase F system-associated protein n=1 Tax=Neotamlana laminarinivorans TaxID=2883124 RepID=A0A9X1I171_9FLAO|nr:exosortase F system-associated protein [Tamlana laminarinivorans]MCB4799913.1 exosortase F system-associated protein [Tamlana laminarinivorans]